MLNRLLNLLRPEPISSPFDSISMPQSMRPDEFYEKVLSAIYLLEKALNKAGYFPQPYSQKALETLMNLSVEQKEHILFSIENWLRTLEDSYNEVLSSPSNVELAQKALRNHNLHLKTDPWGLTSQKDVIEIYNDQGLQLHRSLSFFNYSGYSLLDLYVRKWFELWERPSHILKQLIELQRKVLSGKGSSHIAEVAPHIIKEIFDDGLAEPFLPRSMIFDLKYIFPLFDCRNKIAGFMVIGEVQSLASGREALAMRLK